jgi:methionyl-tRNA formyltransferase
MKTALLSTWNNPFLGQIIASLQEMRVSPEFVICDSKHLNEEALECARLRVGNHIKLKNIYNLDPVIPFYFFENHNSPQVVSFLQSEQIDFLINAGTNRILKTEILEATRGVISCHPGLIPEYRGCCNVEWAILNDDPVGNSVYLMTEEIDRGPILARQSLTFSREDDYQSVRAKVYCAGFALLGKIVKDLVAGRLNPEHLPLPDEGRYYGVISKDDLRCAQEKISVGAYKYQIESSQQ